MLIVDGSNEGTELDFVEQSAWSTGRCYEFTITNTLNERAPWLARIAFGGVISMNWNSVVSDIGNGRREFRGAESSGNVELDSGQSTNFGACYSCEAF